MHKFRAKYSTRSTGTVQFRGLDTYRRSTDVQGYAIVCTTVQVLKTLRLAAVVHYCRAISRATVLERTGGGTG
jgi:hypothetical protein